MWRIIQRSVPVRSELNKRGIPCPIVCPRCLQQEESIDHTFMHCPRANKIWFGSKLGIQFNRSHDCFIDWLIYAITSHDCFIDWLIYAITSICTEDIIYPAAIIYSIWYARNQHIFELNDTPNLTVIEKANKSIVEFQQATSTDQTGTTDQINNNINCNINYQHNPRSTQWIKPMVGTIKKNCDANLSRSGRWGQGATCRDSDGFFVAAATWETPGSDDPTLAEANAVYKAVHLAFDYCFQDVIIESDNETIISLIDDRNFYGIFSIIISSKMTKTGPNTKENLQKQEKASRQSPRCRKTRKSPKSEENQHSIVARWLPRNQKQ
ncbi:hypothetical protein QL285_088153 [Trifolium repens]|nr:hypothetical protein QL285_088153 [Trifolium repens]